MDWFTAPQKFSDQALIILQEVRSTVGLGAYIFSTNVVFILHICVPITLTYENVTQPIDCGHLLYQSTPTKHRLQNSKQFPSEVYLHMIDMIR